MCLCVNCSNEKATKKKLTRIKMLVIYIDD